MKDFHEELRNHFRKQSKEEQKRHYHLAQWHREQKRKRS
ncbi:hypothetical protein JOD17_002531 [Geomicrobium sediminis]|uniref:Uncharacterized protein n=1 Tax=Geomicrobium sediminis TaxID=1347788 RepID=A0ABS2PDR3_9BACL|nr:hypothetical protein [Geomicrobium sediminis]